MNKQELLDKLSKSGVDPATVSREEYIERTSILLPRIVNKSGLEDPAYQTLDSACFDLRASEDVVINPGETVVVKTGLYLSKEESAQRLDLNPSFIDVELLIRPRSGMSAKGITVGGGEVDKDYLIENNENNEIKVILHNLYSPLKQPFEVKRGDRIAQARWSLTVKDASLEVKNNVRTGGLGSTGSK